MKTEECLEAIWKELTSGSRLTERKREAQSAFSQIYGVVMSAAALARSKEEAGSLRAAFRKSGIDLGAGRYTE